MKVLGPPPAREPLPSRFQPSLALSPGQRAALDGLGPWFLKTDPLADAAVADFAELTPGHGFALLERALRDGVADVSELPSAARELLAAAEAVPAWVDRARQDRGGAVVLRAGVLAGIVLGMKSLVLGYASPGGNKPLVFSGRLRQQAPRRLAETSRFLQAVSQPGGLHRAAPGFAITLKVRLMHAQVRRLVERSGRWQRDTWGAPINQFDMLATVLLFSVALVEGLRDLGYRIANEEAEDVVHLWRHVGLIMGVNPELLPESFADASARAALIRSAEGPPDDDSRALTAALFDARQGVLVGAGSSPQAAGRHKAAMQAACRRLIGDPLADALALPRSRFDRVVRLARPLLTAASILNRAPLVRDLAAKAGDRYWDAAVAEGLPGAKAQFTPPDRLAW